MSVRVAINGFGRVGRCAFRSAFESGAPIDWVGINDVADVATLAHLLRHDTVYGPFPGTVEVDGSALVVDGVEIPVYALSRPERTAVGRRRSRRRARVHRQIPLARGRREASRRRRPQGDHLGTRQGRRRDDRPRRQRRRVRPGACTT